ncbi:uncharacterized protein DUF2782 [Kushneria sinocarnis]|uniref:Uncharacterized protein DUF2782 n=1 Tax=Kushneria sinocarnis TaxID=595502 RepID=A0A420WU72_9GAMM|nr:DUF2782 domain-containing protein [Kushneria sinocarnis]RKQ96980.1 uncharacterized protein DUF2782 [Kushneria sinocarnis]
MPVVSRHACFPGLRTWPILLLGLLPALPVAADETPRPRITTHHEADRLIREYRIDHRLYAIEVVDEDTAVTLIDRDGDGNFQRAAGVEGTPPVPDWVRHDE